MGATRHANRIEVTLPTGILSVTVDSSGTVHELNELIGFGARNNAKRGFLFVSRVLGKHLPVTPSRMRQAHEALASRVSTANDSAPVLFIGMAETATGLGQGIFESFLRQHPSRAALYVHSTRYWMDREAMTFEESHSHAPNLCIHRSDDVMKDKLLSQAKSLVLIDDELSTGNTFACLLKNFLPKHPSIRRVSVLSICDFSNGHAARTIQEATEIPVDVGAMLTGAFTFEQVQLDSVLKTSAMQPQKFECPELTGLFGRRPINSAITLPQGRALREIEDWARNYSEARIIATGEFMHPAFVLGGFLEQLGLNVAMQSTTRSPILSGAGEIRCAMAVADHYGENVPNFIYNFEADSSKLTLLCCEGPANSRTREMATQLGARIIAFMPKEESFELSIV